MLFSPPKAYWHWTPWRDVAILTSRTDQCDWMTRESQNVKEKGNCSLPQYNNEQDCNANSGAWTLEPSWGMGKPECLEAPFSRQNSLGNGLDGYHNTYNWYVDTD